MRAVIPLSEVAVLLRRYAASAPVLEAMAVFMTQQVKDRFRTGGASGGTAWVNKKARAWGHNDGRAILTGKRAELLESFQGYGTDEQAVTYSDDPKSLVHQVGTVGAGGKLPTIRPKRAKALFIPLTDRAIESTRLDGPRAAWVRAKGGDDSGSQLPIRAAVSYRGYKAGKTLGTMVFTPLVKGRLKNGKLQRWDARIGEYVDGVPDFIFLSKSDIPPRPMLPVGEQERAAQVRFYLDQLNEAADKRQRRRRA